MQSFGPNELPTSKSMLNILFCCLSFPEDKGRASKQLRFSKPCKTMALSIKALKTPFAHLYNQRRMFNRMCHATLTSRHLVIKSSKLDLMWVFGKQEMDSKITSCLCDGIQKIQR